MNKYQEALKTAYEMMNTTDFGSAKIGCEALSVLTELVDKEKSPTLEEVKKEWEELGYELEVFNESLTIQTTKKCYVPLRDMDWHKNQRFKRISIDFGSTGILYKANYIDNDEPCFITFQEHQLLTKTFKALGWL